MDDVFASVIADLDQLWVTILFAMILGMLRIIFVVFRRLPLGSYLTKIMKPVKAFGSLQTAS